jgi:hypothetical protein
MPEQQIGKVPQLKADAIVNVKMGTAFIGKLQEAFQHHITGHEEDIQKLKEKNPGADGKYADLTPWENTAVTFTTLLQVIMKEAEATGQLEYVDLETLIPSDLAKG